MSPDADGAGLKDALGNLERKGARSASTLWGMMLDHLSDNHAKAVAAAKVHPEGGAVRTPDGVVVTSKEMVMKVFLNADGNYSVSGNDVFVSGLDSTVTGFLTRQTAAAGL